jgi:hypothetical protein
MVLYIKYSFIRFKDRITVYVTVMPFVYVPFFRVISLYVVSVSGMKHLIFSYSN